MGKEQGIVIQETRVKDDFSIEIGSFPYLISKEAIGYLANVVQGEYSRKPKKSVLMIGEPHFNPPGQFNLYKFLEIFFRDNPTLVPRTIFLAEGFPVNQPISVASLVKEEPNPSEELIMEVLESFLITGYMAYEWKYRKGIPIVGTEDPILYQISNRLWVNGVSGEVGPLLGLSYVARNKSITDTLFEKAKRYLNPILFVGNTHLDRTVSSEDQEKILEGIKKFLTVEEFRYLMKQNEELRNWGIHEYLGEKGIGYTFLDIRQGEDILGEQIKYTLLMKAQEEGGYNEYIKWLVSQRTANVTVRPTPEVAAQFVKELKKVANPEAKRISNQGFVLETEGKYIEAAKEYSAASAADPKDLRYVVNLQRVLLKELEARFKQAEREADPQVQRGPFRIVRVKTNIEIGPYLERDHEERISSFAKKFANISGATKVAEIAMSGWINRLGGAFQIKVAEVLGPEKIRAFEEEHKPKGGGVNRIDISTSKDVAIECKYFIGRVTIGAINGWIEQAVCRFKPDEMTGHSYKYVLIVIPDGKNIEEIKTVAQQYIRANYPEFLNKIDFGDPKRCRFLPHYFY